jgi:hypothetical protein
VSQLMKSGRWEWDDQVIITCMYPHYASEVMKIHLSKRDNEDFLAWHYERTCLCTVRGAYKLASEGEMQR